MMQPPTEEQLAELWYAGLSVGEREIWREETGATPGVTDLYSKLACWRLYWSRGPQLDDRDINRLSKGNCPVCNRRGFVIGPAAHGEGRWMQLNIECAQLDCRSRFNVAFMSGQALIGHHLPNGATADPWPSEPSGVIFE